MAEQRLQIVIGNRRYSSWSLRGWLAVRVAAGETGFDTVYLPLSGAGAEAEAREEARQRLLAHSPTGLVPVLHDRVLGVSVYDSLAIAEHV
jgi:glutathione S-transferase